MYVFDGIQSGNYFGGEPIRGTEEYVRVGKLTGTKTPSKDEVIMGGVVMDWI